MFTSNNEGGLKDYRDELGSVGMVGGVAVVVTGELFIGQRHGLCHYVISVTSVSFFSETL